MIHPQDPGVWRSATTAWPPSPASPSPASRGRCGGSSSLTTSSPESRQTASPGWRSSTSWTYQVTTSWKTLIAGGLLKCSRQQLQRQRETWQQILLESNFLMAFPLKAINIQVISMEKCFDGNRRVVVSCWEMQRMQTVNLTRWLNANVGQQSLNYYNVDKLTTVHTWGTFK